MKDIDIDVKDRNAILQTLPKYVHASIIRDNTIKRHNVGIYLQNIPSLPQTNIEKYDTLRPISTMDYEHCSLFEDIVKIDLINNSIYSHVKDNDHLESLLSKEPPWAIFSNADIVNELPHLSGHFETVLKHHLPIDSVDKLAMVLALIRPGKRYLVGKPWDHVKKDIWKPTKDYYYKKSHAYAYAFSLIVYINAILSESNQEQQ